jgi:DNA repair protein RadC
MKIQVVSLKMEKDKILSSKYSTSISSPNDVVEIYGGIATEFIKDMDREHMILMCVDTKNKITSISNISIGSLNSAIIHPREVFKVAILSNAASIIIAHNHPSGDTTPSTEDINITNRLKECSKILGIELLDHIIVGNDDDFMSFKREGLI